LQMMSYMDSSIAHFAIFLVASLLLKISPSVDEM
jgi:hypothetical protein